MVCAAHVHVSKYVQGQIGVLFWGPIAGPGRDVHKFMTRALESNQTPVVRVL
jgi:hypothetical protein